jgi:hypothetical protein
MVAVIGDIEPRDQMEAMLAAQMAVVHMATMSFSSSGLNALFRNSILSIAYMRPPDQK